MNCRVQQLARLGTQTVLNKHLNGHCQVPGIQPVSGGSSDSRKLLVAGEETKPNAEISQVPVVRVGQRERP